MKKLIQDFKNFETYEKGGVYFCLLFIVPALYCAIENIILNLL